MKILSMGGGTVLSTLLKSLKGHIYEERSGDILELVLQKFFTQTVIDTVAAHQY
jgi:hypothetical protein